MASPQDTCQLDGCKKETTIFCLTCKNYFCLNDYREHDLSDTHRFRRDRRDRRDRRRGRRASRDRRHRPRCAVGHANHPCPDDVSDHRPTDREVSDFQQLVLRVFNLQAYLRQYDHPFHHITFDNPAIREAHFPQITNYLPTDRENHFRTNADYFNENARMFSQKLECALIDYSSEYYSSSVHMELSVICKNRVIIHCSLDDTQRCEPIVKQLKATDYIVELNGKLTDPVRGIRTNYIIPCLSSNYENDLKRQRELEYAFKSQYHIVPVCIQSDFKPQQVWLQRILESKVLSAIDFSELMMESGEAHEQLLLRLSKYANEEGAATISASRYLKIYQECCNQSWIDIPKLLLHMHAYLLHNAIDKGSLDDIAKMINLMHTLNDQFQEKAQVQIDLFHKWLIEIVQENKNESNQDSMQKEELLQTCPEHCVQKKPEKFNDEQAMQRKVREVVIKAMESLQLSGEHNDMQQVSDIFKSIAIKDSNRTKKSKKRTTFNVASSLNHHETARIVLKHYNSMMKENIHGQIQWSQAKDGYTQKKCAQHPEITPSFAGDSFDWTIPYEQAALKRAQIRQYLTRAHFINNRFATIYQRYIRCYLALEGFSNQDIYKLERMECNSSADFLNVYTSVTRFYQVINRHLAIYALGYFQSSFDITIPYSFVHCLLSIIAIVWNGIHFRQSYTDPELVYRGMKIRREDLYKYVVGSQVINPAFLSASKMRLCAERYAGIDGDLTSSAHDPSQMRVVFSYKIRNFKTAFDIQQLVGICGEWEVIIFPFSAFRVTRRKETFSNIVEIDLEECDEEQWRENSGEEECFYSPF